MEVTEKEIGLSDIGLALKRRFRLMAFVSLTIALFGLLIALFLPPIYRSQAVILIEKQEIPVDLVRSTVTSFADQRIQVISQRVMTSTNLTRIMDEFDLYEDLRDRETREEILDRMRDNIRLDMISADVVDPKSGRPTEATIAFSLAFEDENAGKAQRVANELVTLFLNENIKSRRDTAMETTAFLDDEAESLRRKVVDLEDKIAKFKDANSGNRPELESLTRDLMNRTELNLAEVERRIHEFVQQKIYLSAELAKHPAILPDFGPRLTSAEEQLRSTEAALASAMASYGESHPDVIKLKKQAEGLRVTVEPEEARALYEQELAAARASLQIAIKNYKPEHPDVIKARNNVNVLADRLAAIPPVESDPTPNNPAYVALAARLEASNAQLNSLYGSRDELTAKLEKYAESLMLMPDAEAEYRALTRDYETAVGEYQEISAKQTQARLSQNLESERKGEKFTLIEPPLLPEKSAKPNKPAIIFISCIFGLMAGAGSARIAEVLDDRVRSRADIQAIFNAPPLAHIPYIEGDEPRSGLNYNTALTILAVIIVMICLSAVHLMFMPLDVLWFSLMRKIGL